MTKEPPKKEDAIQSAVPFLVGGIYFHDGFSADPPWHAPLYWDEESWLKEIRWLHACGINTVEFATMLEFNRTPSTWMERRRIADRLKVLEMVHSLGMEFGYILTNTVVSTVPDGEEPSHQLNDRAVELCPQVAGNFERTVELQKWYMKTYREADFFEEFAADWGGCRCGVCSPGDFLRYVEALAGYLEQFNSRARLYANTWCIGYWNQVRHEAGWKLFYDREIAGSREVMKGLSGMPKNTHLGLPCHHLYRALAFSSYGGEYRTPVFPTAEEIASFRSTGRDVQAWPHFAMDDDPYRQASWGIVHSEVRYIREILQRLQRTGIDRVMGNLYLPWLQISNTYAYGRLLKNPQENPREILLDFSRLVAHPADAERLAEVMAWVENRSYWEEQLPEDARLERLDCPLTRRQARLEVGRIRPCSSPELPLPIKPGQWLKDLERSIGRMTWVNG